MATGGASGLGRTALLVVPLLTASLAGCLAEVSEYYGYDPDVQYVNPGVFPGRYAAVESGSTVLTPGTLPYSPDAEVFRIRSDQDGALIPIAVWRPYDGLVEGGVPILVDAGPYFERFADRIDEPQMMGEWMLRNFVPHGYAYAQVAVRGTGTHGGCMELMSQTEARDVSQAVTFLANLPWANGNASMIGVSYDGSTPWMVAGLGNPHLRSIVPMSGVPDLFSLMFRNGSAESRGAIMHAGVYWPYGFNFRGVFGLGWANGEREPYQEVQNVACPEVVRGAALGPYAAVVGERDPETVGYWDERDWRDDVLANFDGRVFLIHGLQDWNVEPHVAVPFNRALREAGIEVKEWYGQWGHSRPDSVCSKEYPEWQWLPCRGDFAEVLLRFWDRTLKGVAVDDGPDVQVQDDHGYWRNADAYPPTGLGWVELYPVASGDLDAQPGEEVVATLLPPDPRTGAPANYAEFTSAPFENDTRLTGLPQLQATFEAAGPGGFLGAWLWTEDADGRVHGLCWWDADEDQVGCAPRVTGWGQMDLRFREGGEEAQPVVPGLRDVAHLEFEPLDALVPAGHRVTVWVFQYPYADHVASPVASAVRLVIGGPDATVLRLPTMPAEASDTFPVPGSHTPDPRDYHRYMVAKPRFDQVVDPYAPGDGAGFGIGRNL